MQNNSKEPQSHTTHTNFPFSIIEILYTYILPYLRIIYIKYTLLYGNYCWYKVKNVAYSENSFYCKIKGSLEETMRYFKSIRLTHIISSFPATKFLVYLLQTFLVLNRQFPLNDRNNSSDTPSFKSLALTIVTNLRTKYNFPLP